MRLKNFGVEGYSEKSGYLPSGKEKDKKIIWEGGESLKIITKLCFGFKR